jgi:hypothetical protein
VVTYPEGDAELRDALRAPAHPRRPKAQLVSADDPVREPSTDWLAAESRGAEPVAALVSEEDASDPEQQMRAWLESVNADAAARAPAD